MSTTPKPVPISQVGVAIRLCALANLQSALALPFLAARRVTPAGAESLFVLVIDHLQGTLASFESMRQPPQSVTGPQEALKYDTVEYSTRELRRVLDELIQSRSESGDRHALQEMPGRIDHAIRRLVSALPADSPLRPYEWSTTLEAASAIPTAQLVHYLALSPVGVVVRQTLYSAAPKQDRRSG